MFEDFLNLNYWKTPNKLAKIRKLLNRIGKQQLPTLDFDLGEFDSEIKKINDRLDRMNPLIQNLPQVLKEREETEEEEPTELLPDLIVDEIIPIEEDHYIDFDIVVKNQGTADSIACKLNVVIPSNEESNVELDVPALTVGSSTTLHHQYSFDPSSPLPKESKTIMTTVDATNIVTESNETNNTRSIQFDVLPQKAGLIVHIHNPEGKEIGSIVGSSDISLSHGTIPIDESTHGVPTILSPGDYTITANFNGIELEKDLTIKADICYEIFFTFERIEHVPDWNASQSFTMNDIVYLGNKYSQNSYERLEIDPDNPWTMKGYENISYSGPPYDPDDYITVIYNQSIQCSLNKSNFNYSLDYNFTVIGGYLLSHYSWLAINPFSGTIGSIVLPNNMSNFSNWFIQQKCLGTYITIGVYQDGDFKGYLARNSENYLYEKLPSHLTNVELKASNLPVVMYSVGSISESGQLLKYKMSSIPYDMEGTAV